MRLLMVDRAKDGECEAELVLVAVADGCAVLYLDDGESLSFDLSELQEALASGELADEVAA